MASLPPGILQFYSPRRSPAFVAFLRAIANLVLRFAWGIRRVEIGRDDVERLRSIRNSPAMILANHPTLSDPGVLFKALSIARVNFHIIIAWDTIALHGRAFTWALQRLGGYSINRGRPDRASMRMTHDLLLKGERIMIFPEGSTYGLNDTLLPFQQGVAQMGFRAAEEMGERRINAPLMLVPAAIKYRWLNNMDSEIARSLSRLEARLGISPASDEPYPRLVAIASAVLESAEHNHGLELEPGMTLAQRIDRLRDYTVNRLAESFEVNVPRDLPFTVVVQLLGNAYDDAVATVSESNGDSEQRIEQLQALHADWLRLKNFLAVRDGYVSERPTAERFTDVLSRLEVEVLGGSEIRGPRSARVVVGEPFDIRSRLTEYKANKRATIESVTRDIECQVGQLLSSL